MNTAKFMYIVVSLRYVVLSWSRCFKQKAIFEGVRFTCGTKNGHHKDMFKRDWATCSINVNHSRLNGQDNWGDIYDHLMSTRIFTLTMIKVFI